MRPGFANEYMTGVVIIEERDFPLDENNLVNTAREFDATKSDPEDGKELFIVRLPNRFDEAYTEDALRRSVRSINRIYKA